MKTVIQSIFTILRQIHSVLMLRVYVIIYIMKTSGFSRKEERKFSLVTLLNSLKNFQCVYHLTCWSRFQV